MLWFVLLEGIVTCLFSNGYLEKSKRHIIIPLSYSWNSIKGRDQRVRLHSIMDWFGRVVFSCRHATLHLAMLVGPSIGPSVRPSVSQSVHHISEFWAFFALLLLPNRPRLFCRVSSLVLYGAWSWLLDQDKSITGCQRAICGQQYQLPCFAWLWIVVKGTRAAVPKSSSENS